MTEAKEATSLGKYINEKYIAASGKRKLAWWARETTISHASLHSIVHKDRIISMSTILKLSKTFGDTPESLIRMQNKFLLAQIESKDDLRPLRKIERPVVIPKQHLLRETLMEKFLKPMNLKLSDLARHLNIQYDVFRRYFHHSNRLKNVIDYKVAARIGEALGTPGKVWLDIQTNMLLDDYLKENPYATQYFDWKASLNFSSQTPKNAPSPGSVLDREYLQPSGIAILYWADFFCVGERTLKRIIAGKTTMDFKFIALLAKAFPLPATYWIELQNEYLISRYFKETVPGSGLKIIQPRWPTKRRCQTNPGQILMNNFLKPRKIKTKEFARYVGSAEQVIKRLISGHNHITVAWALKLAKVFGNSPMFWLDLQMDFDLANSQINYERRDHEEEKSNFFNNPF